MSAGFSPALCQEALDGVGSGVAASLRAVDCAAAATSQAAFGRLFGSDGALLPALTVLLTLYVAFFAFGLITGRSTLGISALTPRMVTLGLVLTFATSWVAWQGTVYNLVVGAPNQIANILMGGDGSATDVFADKVDTVFAVLVQASGDEAMEGATSTFSPPGLLWLGATLLLLGTVGLLATTKIALAVLMAVGPVFVVLALFDATRGLFTGWLKGVVLLAVTPLFAVLGGSLMLELAVPVLQALSMTPGKIEPQPAMAFFMIGAVHLALMVMVLKVAGTMVAGWTVFGLANTKEDKGGAATAAAAARGAAAAVVAATPAEARTGAAPSREIRLAGAVLPAAANDRGGMSSSITRETRIVGGAGPSSAAGASPAAGPSRARGIGSRFRAAPPRANPARTS
ncbi:type IV secretion system protein [Croceibacterium sp. TMG7-5b_MA50]|uniref:type IV secretion system protein n=1 Tax=Croceibacterium sp. TMG7-5b_MA50 TaxID=3121290 RepID=UPI003221A0ED